jgi:hypothetical protein
VPTRNAFDRLDTFQYQECSSQQNYLIIKTIFIFIQNCYMFKIPKGDNQTRMCKRPVENP